MDGTELFMVNKESDVNQSVEQGNLGIIGNKLLSIESNVSGAH